MVSGNGIKGLNKLIEDAFVGLCMYDKVRSVEVNITYLTNYDFDDNFIQIERYCEIDVGMLESFHYMSRHVGKPTICIGENKGADQLRSNCEADQRLCFRYSDSTIPPLLNSKISSF